MAVADQGLATVEVNAALLTAFRARGIVIPYPQREVRLIADRPRLKKRAPA